ncbi:MAG: hypothetical protein H0T04_02020 [Chloroflexi bacterium]|nr:hypothetical protein [Chloroflexota bacterium]
MEQVYAGDLRPGLQTRGAGRPSCHPTYYSEGVRYLISSSPQNRDAFSVVDYRLLDGDRLRMHPFEGSVADYPLELQVDDLEKALVVLVIDALPPTDDESPRESPGSAAFLVMVGLLGLLLGKRRFGRDVT